MEPGLVPASVRILIAVLFLAVGAADLTLGATGGEIAGVVVAVPLLASIGVAMRRRRARS